MLIGTQHHIAELTWLCHISALFAYCFCKYFKQCEGNEKGKREGIKIKTHNLASNERERKKERKKGRKEERKKERNKERWQARKKMIKRKMGRKTKEVYKSKKNQYTRLKLTKETKKEKINK